MRNKKQNFDSFIQKKKNQIESKSISDRCQLIVWTTLSIKRLAVVAHAFGFAKDLHGFWTNESIAMRLCNWMCVCMYVCLLINF